MPMSNSDDRAEAIIKRFDYAVGLRGNWETQWEAIAKRILPNYSGSFNSGGLTRSQGEDRTTEMIDATGAIALPKFAAVAEYLLTPRTSIWQKVVPTDRKLLKNRMTKLWFEEVTDILFKYRYAAKANYASQKFETYLGLGAFGTGCLFTDALKGGGLRFRAIHLGEVYFLENHQGIIDTAFRKFPLTARQACQWFGMEKVPAKIRECMKDTSQPANMDKTFYFIHCVGPREDYDSARMDMKGMAFSYEYVNVEEKAVVKEEGYNSFPYSISRYVQAPGELYGRSPAMIALPSLKTLNEQKKTVLKQGHRAIDPVLLAHDDGIIDTFSLKPGVINAGGVSAEGRPLVHALPVGNLALAKEMMEAETVIIKDVFLISLFQILIETPQMTATEVIERTREKGVFLSPLMGRQTSEALGPEGERAIDLLAQQGLLPPMPPMLREAKGEYNFEYDSPMSRAQKAENAAGLFRTVDWLTATINITQDASLLDHINWDEAVPEILDIQAVPARWQRSIESVQEIRAGRKQAMNDQKMVDAAPAMASVMKNVMPAGAGAAR